MMHTVQAAEGAVSIWFSREEAPSRRQLLAMVRRALEERGLAPWPETEAECFAAGEDTLVIARPGAARCGGFLFDDLEDLLSGALACPDAASSLYVWGTGYLLTVAPEAVRPALYEYGRPMPVRADWECHAREQGRCLLSGSAISDLRRCFAP